MPTLEKLATSDADRFRIVVVSQDLQGAEAVTPFFQSKGLKALKPYLDQKNVLMTAFETETLPTTVSLTPRARNNGACWARWTGAARRRRR
jgi:hypothetical protein